ncbi:MAG: ABC transporter ATP-binding protein [Defluviitaleaceae bacterium]|nr:ABC transporter ATP-binding protein [Defluviitaleaceae bacterium]MCL2274004.1 ABC transporter ATP-binding protein [Defluviitaleaceae bacterium]MCL2274095.1 ABC transporter ATP-binding protein [Defluviitaleaceae bacterium]
MLKITDVSKTYGNNIIKAVDNISMEVQSKQILGFIGPNGAGKTTTMKMITGVLEPDGGTITINGHDITSDPLAAKQSFGYVPDSPDMFLRLKGIEYLNFMGDMYGVSNEQRQEKIASMGETFEMTGALNARIQSYSHGMRQKIIIMGALLHNPALWILDEPLTGLDPRSSFQLKEMMRAHAEAGNCVLFSTHMLEVAEKLCDKIALINKGRIIFMGELDELIAQHNNKSLEDIFMEVTANA